MFEFMYAGNVGNVCMCISVCVYICMHVCMKSCRLNLGLESRAVPALAWKVAPSPPWCGKSRPRFRRESRAVSVMVAQGGHATSGYRSKLHSRAESLSLDIRTGKSGHESRHGSRRIQIQTQIE